MCKSLLFSLLLCLSLTQLSFAQEPCGTVSPPPPPVNMGMTMNTADPLPNIPLPPDQIVIIPVVVHVVYNTEAQNISLAQIQSQIDVLNEDFMRLNSDANDTWPQAANPYMQFELARFDPESQPTSGITRTYTDSLDFGHPLSIKRENTGGITPWDATGYLNLYSGNIRNFLGYATFPDADDTFDGAVLDYTVFGRGDEFSLLPQFNLGRTGTHEVGHWLRLDHIWGQVEECFSDDDFVDTPNSDGPNYGCQIGSESCGSVDMVENYMDYTDDSCSNLFTVEQVERMRAMFSSRGSRVTILTSSGLGLPSPTYVCPDESVEVNLTINFDEFPQDTSWDIKNENGEIIASGGPYIGGYNEALNIPSEFANTQFKETFCLLDGCLSFTMYDAFGDGLYPIGGVPPYTLQINDENNITIIGDDFFQSAPEIFDAVEIQSDFCIECILSTPLTTITASSITDCSFNSPHILTANGGIDGSNARIDWYDGPNATGNYLGSGNPITMYSRATPSTYYAMRVGSCTSSYEDVSITLDVLIDNDFATLTDISASATSICPNTSAVLSANGGEDVYEISVFWYDGPNGTGNYLGNTPSITVMPMTTTTYYARREGLCNTTDDVSITIEVLENNGSASLCPPDNDEIPDAINLPVGSAICETVVIATNAGATNSIENDNEASCSSFDPAGDVWFKVMVPSSGNLTIETALADDNPIFDTVMEVYSGSSGALIEIACDDNNGNDLFSSVTIIGRTSGEVLLVRVWEFGDDLKGNFNICAWSPSNLGIIEDNTFEGFTYFPNPVKDILTLESPRTIDEVEVYNVLGQRMISINSQNTVQNIDMSTIQAGMYFVKISIGTSTKTIRVVKD